MPVLNVLNLSKIYVSEYFNIQIVKFFYIAGKCYLHA